jgi:hypothetical protein
METYLLEVSRIHIYHSRIRGRSWVCMLYVNLVNLSDSSIADLLATRIRVITRL